MRCTQLVGVALCASVAACHLVAPYEASHAAARDGVGPADGARDGPPRADEGAPDASDDATSPPPDVVVAPDADAGFPTPAGPLFIRASSGASDGPSVSFAHAVSPGVDRLLLVAAHAYTASQRIAGVTYAGLPLTPIGEAAVADTPVSADCTSTLWYLVDPPEGTEQVVASLSGSARPMAAWAMSFEGVEQAAPIGDSVSVVGKLPTVFVVGYVRGATNELTVDALCLAAPTLGKLAAAGTDQVERVRQDAADGNMRAAGSTAPGAPTAAMKWDFDSAYFTHLAVALRPSTAGP